MRTLVVLTLVAGLLLAGCNAPVALTPGPSTGALPGGLPPHASDAPSPGSSATFPHPSASGSVPLRGVVVSAAIVPIANATVDLLFHGLTKRTGQDGTFDFGELPRGIFVLHAEAPGFLSANRSVAPEEASDVKMVLQAGAPRQPYHTLEHFKGRLQCALEAVIISPSCDSALVVVAQPPVFGQNTTFSFPVDAGWTTVVADVVFDESGNPGLDGLRIAVRGTLDPNGVGEYRQYGRWHGATSFTARIEPDGNYTDGDGPVPAAASAFAIEVYPHSHAYHQVPGFLGAGAGIDVEFDLYVSTFYVEAAPEGYSFNPS